MVFRIAFYYCCSLEHLPVDTRHVEVSRTLGRVVMCSVTQLEWICTTLLTISRYRYIIGVMANKETQLRSKTDLDARISLPFHPVLGAECPLCPSRNC